MQLIIFCEGLRSAVFVVEYNPGDTNIPISYLWNETTVWNKCVMKTLIEE